MRQVITNCSALCNPNPGRCKILQEIGPNVTLMSCDHSDVRRSGKRRVHPERGDRLVRLPGVPRPAAADAVRHQRGAAGARRAAGPPDIGAVRSRRDGDRDPGPAGGTGRRPVRDQRGAGRGVRQTIGDTLGIGGIFRGLRTIPVTVALARDMAEVCPDAYLLSYSNPMAMLPWAVY